MAIAGLTSCNHDLSDHFGVSDNPSEGGGSTPAAAPTYLKWNDGTQALEAVEIPDAPSMTSTTTTWSGTYIVSEDVTIDDDVTLGGDVDLIMLDGKTLTLTDDHWITASTNYTLNIYGQSTTTGAGKLVVNTTTSKNFSINVVSGTVNIHSGIVSATATNGNSFAVWSKNMNVYGGEVEAKGFKVGLKVDNLNILGGKVTAENGDGAATWAIESSTIIIDGATTSVTAKGGKAIYDGGNGDAASQGINVKTSMTINDGEVIVTGGDGITGMGNGAVALYVPNPTASLTVNGGSLTATGGKGVGGGSGGQGGHGIEALLTISGDASVTTAGGDSDKSSVHAGNGIRGGVAYQSGTISATGGLNTANPSNNGKGVDAAITNYTAATVTFQYSKNGSDWTSFDINASGIEIVPEIARWFRKQ